MISCTEFIWCYNELFRFLEEEDGEEKVIEFWKGISDNFLANLRQYIEKDGLAGMYKYWSHTLGEEGGRHHLSLYDDMFVIDMQDCPSAKLVHQSGRVKPYEKYCEHCRILYPPIIESYGYEVDYDLISCEKGRCRLTVREKEKPCLKSCQTIASCILRTSEMLVPITDTPRLEAELLLAHALGLTRASLLARLRDPEEDACLEPLLARRLDHEPLAYIFGEWEFFGLPLFVEPPLLVPRPETEGLVEVALKFLAACETTGPVADLCCGTGCVAVALGHHAPGRPLYACDIRADAVALTQRNAARHHVALHGVQGDLFEALDPLCDCYDVIVSNPPYVPDEEWQDLSPVIAKHEDPGALLSGKDGLDLIRRIIPEARLRLRKGGLLALELGEGQSELVAGLLRENGFEPVETHKDLAGIDRIVSGIRNE